MLRACRLPLTLATVLTLVTAPALTAQEVNADAEANPKTSANAAVSQAGLAAQLAFLGEQLKSPLLLLSAAELLGPLTDSSREVDGIEAEKAEHNSDKTKPSLSYRSLLDRAEALAKDDEGLRALVAARVKELRGQRGLVEIQGKNKKSVTIAGVTYKVLDTDVISSNSATTYRRVFFEGKKPAAVVVIGDGDGDLDLYIYDGNTGGLIGSDEGRDSTPIVKWTTRYQGPFTIKIKNVGNIAERYVLLANW